MGVHLALEVADTCFPVLFDSWCGHTAGCTGQVVLCLAEVSASGLQCTEQGESCVLVWLFAELFEVLQPRCTFEFKLHSRRWVKFLVEVQSWGWC